MGIYHGKQKHESDLALVLERAALHGVEAIIVTAGCLEEVEAAQDFIARQSQFAQERSGEGRPPCCRLLTTVGVHPTRCLEFGDPEDSHIHIEKLSKLLRGREVCAIGELGLDYDRLEHCPKEVQLRGFEAQLSMAETSGLPLFLHSRAAAADMHKVLSRNRHRFSDGVGI